MTDNMTEKTRENQALLEEIKRLHQELNKLKEDKADLEYLLEISSEHSDIVSAELQKAKEQAEQAQSEAEMANHAKSAFLANMSHELRTPLNGILGYAQILQHDRTLTDKQKDGIKIISQSGEHLLTLINDILDLSKIEAGKLELIKNDFFLPTFLQGIVDLFRLRAEEKDILFTYQEIVTTKGLPKGVYGDEKRLRQVLLNFLSNAMKFTQPRGKVTFTVNYQSKPTLDNPQLGQFFFQVQDSGIGIAPKDLNKIFEPFQQVGEISQQIEGTGLGLPISQKLVKMMGGQVSVKSELGQGSSFEFDVLMPTVLSLENTEPHFPSPLIIGFKRTEERRNETGDSKPIRILVADDSVANRSLLVDLLEPLGFDIQQASNGQEVLLKIHENHPEILLIDSMMPSMDCFECVRQLRQHDDSHKIIIIAISANVFAQHQQECLEAGCDTFLGKPIDIKKLFNLLETYLSLEWIYDESTCHHHKPQKEGLIKGPSLEQAEALFNLVLMGDIRGIIDYVEKLGQNDEQMQPFAEQVGQLAKTFQEQKLEELLKPYFSS
jgi:signal transduction histidine kinase/CheY-like chemotaxis protein